MAKQKYTDEFLMSEMKRYYEENNETPNCVYFTSKNGYPSIKTYSDRFGSWNNALLLAGFNPNVMNSHSKDEIIKNAKDFYSNNNRTPFYYELNYSMTVLRQYWETYNDFLRDANLDTNSSDRTMKTKEDGVNLILQLHKELDRIPASLDIEKYTNSNRTWFRSHFGSWENALISSGLIQDIGKITKEDIIDNTINCLRDVSNNLKRFPTVSEFDKYIKTKDTRTVVLRRTLCNYLNMTYLQICDEYLDYGLLENGYGNVCFDLNNKRCKSVDECIISNSFIKNNLSVEYEPNYKDIIKTEKVNYKFDWKIIHRDKAVYVEYFGLYYPKDKSKLIQEYIQKAHKKITLCEDNKVELIDIYPDDLENGLKGFINKFKEHGINISDEIKNSA